jgi:hypothetical protein
VAEASPLHGFFTIFGAVFAAIGAVFLAVGLLLRVGSRRLRGGQRAEGRIVDFRTASPTRTAASGIIYQPTVTFTTSDGQEVTATSPYGSNPRPGKVGDSVTVLYDPRDPQRVRVETRGGVSGCLTGGFVALGGGMLALGIVILVSAR